MCVRPRALLLVRVSLAALTRSRYPRTSARARTSRARPPRVSDLRDPWNVLDFTVVATSAVDWIPGMPQTSGLRTLRILRPLKSLNKLPGYRHGVGTSFFFFFWLWGYCCPTPAWCGTFCDEA